MTENFLAKEREFRKMNEELEGKTRSMMLEIDSLINSKLDFNKSAEFNDKSTGNSVENIATQIIEITDNDLSNSKRVTTTPKTAKQKKEHDKLKDDSGNEAVVMVLETKVQMLQDELNIIQVEYKKQSNMCKALEADCKKNDMVKKKLQNQIQSLQENIAKLETSNSNLQKKFDVQKAETSAHAREVEDLKRELTAIRNQTSSYEVRLNRSLEENESLKSTLKLSQLEEKELRDKLKKVQDSSALELKNMEKQCSELLKAFKKQSLLVDNLKKQTAYLEAVKQIQITESEFAKLLDWNPEGA